MDRDRIQISDPDNRVSVSAAAVIWRIVEDMEAGGEISVTSIAVTPEPAPLLIAILVTSIADGALGLLWLDASLQPLRAAPLAALFPFAVAFDAAAMAVPHDAEPRPDMEPRWAGEEGSADNDDLLRRLGYYEGGANPDSAE